MDLEREGVGVRSVPPELAFNGQFAAESGGHVEEKEEVEVGGNAGWLPEKGNSYCAVVGGDEVRGEVGIKRRARSCWRRKGLDNGRIRPDDERQKDAGQEHKQTN